MIWRHHAAARPDLRQAPPHRRRLPTPTSGMLTSAPRTAPAMRNRIHPGERPTHHQTGQPIRYHTTKQQEDNAGDQNRRRGMPHIAGGRCGLEGVDLAEQVAVPVEEAAVDALP